MGDEKMTKREMFTYIQSQLAIPFYGTNSSNIASQKVAHKAGFMPVAMCDYKVRFEGELSNI